MTQAAPFYQEYMSLSPPLTADSPTIICYRKAFANFSTTIMFQWRLGGQTGCRWWYRRARCRRHDNETPFWTRSRLRRIFQIPNSRIKHEKPMVQRILAI